MNKKPTTPAETFCFVDHGIWEILRSLTEQLEAAKQIVARGSDAMTDYEKALKKIARHSSCPFSKNDAKCVLKKYRIK